MCDTCGCGNPEIVPVEIRENLLAHNDRRAAHNREHFLAAGVTAVNLMGSPGSGKTALLETTARRLGDGSRLGAVSGDLATEHDAERLRAVGIDSRAITTGSACHLEASLVHHALHEMDWRSYEYFFIENVGNLVCPAIYDLGQAANVVVLSVTEGADKPAKYPVMFNAADLVLLSKTDLLPHLHDVSVAAVEDYLARVMPEPKLIPVSAVTGEGIAEWMAWLHELGERTRAVGPDQAARSALLGHEHGDGHDHHHPDHDHPDHDHPDHDHHHHSVGRSGD